MHNIVTNVVDQQKYFISVTPVQKSSSMLEILTTQKMGRLRKINFEAFIYRYADVKKLPNTLPDRMNAFYKIKPLMTMFLGQKEGSSVVTQGFFQDQINKLVTRADINSDIDIVAKLDEIGYEASIHETLSPWWSSKFKMVYFFEKERFDKEPDPALQSNSELPPFRAADDTPLSSKQLLDMPRSEWSKNPQGWEEEYTITALEESQRRSSSHTNDLKPYLDAKGLEHRRIVFIHCEDETCGFVVEFKHSNCTFFFCKEHRAGFNLDLDTVSDAGVMCEQHGKMERYDLLADDNVCPSCEKSTLAIISAGTGK